MLSLFTARTRIALSDARVYTKEVFFRLLTYLNTVKNHRLQMTYLQDWQSGEYRVKRNCEL